MTLIISSIEDKSSVLYEGRAKISGSEDICAMNRKWRERLEDAIKESGQSKRAVSLKSGMGPGYVHSILKEHKDPGVESLLAVCNAIGVSLSSILYGIEIGPEDEELLGLIQQSSPERRAALLSILKEKLGP